MMCDTIAATGQATADGITLFGKNSDRDPNEAQNLRHIPGLTHPPGNELKCTYITIPQVEKTNTVLLSQPFWMWGAEMGVNTHGLAIGNEAVFTKVPYDKKPGLTGMDLLRLALERAATARQAVDIITALLETHGQGGNCGYEKQLYYHNSFLMADPDSVWVLETAGPHWAAKKIAGVYAISNKLTIENQWDLASEDLVSFAQAKGWCRAAEDFSFAGCYSDFLYTKFSSSEYRQSRAMTLLDRKQGKLKIKDFFDFLRDHGSGSPEQFSPDRGLLESQICNHAGWGPVRISQTTGSLVSRLTQETSLNFATGTSAPCISLFKPLWTDTPPEPDRCKAGKTFDPSTLFWAHEKVHRAVLNNYQKSMTLIVPERDRLEAQLMQNAMSGLGHDRDLRQLITDRSFEAGFGFEKTCFCKVNALLSDKPPQFLYARSWQKRNRAINFPVV